MNVLFQEDRQHAVPNGNGTATVNLHFAIAAKKSIGNSGVL
jgi:hypothetical protein